MRDLAGCQGRESGAADRLGDGSQARPSGWEAYGRGTAARPGRPAPAGRRSPPLRTTDDTGRAPAMGGAVLYAPGILSPRKLTLKGATCGRVLRTALRTALDRELPRQDLGTYQEDGASDVAAVLETVSSLARLYPMLRVYAATASAR